MSTSRLHTFGAATFAIGALIAMAPGAGATAFGDGCLATHGKRGSSVEGNTLHESCTWGNGGWTEYQDSPVKPSAPTAQPVPPQNSSQR
ncbi:MULTISPECIES: hypothetical protein [unclassified Mycobacterium]|uniref:hypothetical protein n=1 Tax=unclassified Mycobacterium TaxID=2642494 RepID=UPI0029C806ED|nr:MULTISPECIES: hypothetical protein [unclassified Mycobacterium]